LAYLSLTKEGRYARRIRGLGFIGGKVNINTYLKGAVRHAAWHKKNRQKCRLNEARWRQKVKDFTGGCSDLQQAIFINYNQQLKLKQRKEDAEHALKEVRRIQKMYPNHYLRGHSYPH